MAFPRRLLGATLDVGRAVPGYRAETQRVLPAMVALTIAAAAGYLAGIAGAGSSARLVR